MKKDGKGQAEYDKNALMLMKDICLDRPDEMLPGQVWTNSHLEEPYRWKLSDTILNMWGNNIDKMKSEFKGTAIKSYYRRISSLHRKMGKQW